MSGSKLWTLYILGDGFHRVYTYTNGKSARDYWDKIVESEIAAMIKYMAMYFGDEIKLVHLIGDPQEEMRFTRYDPAKDYEGGPTISLDDDLPF